MAQSKLNIEFNLRNLTARDMTGFFRATRENDHDGIAAVLAKVVTACPAEWGAADDPDTYLNLPYFGEFQDVIEAFSEEAAKNGRKR